MQPVLTPSPSSAPSLRRPVAMRAAPSGTTICLPSWRKLESTVPAPRLTSRAENRVADVVEVRRLRFRQQDRALDLGVGADARAVADPAAAAHVGAGADLDVVAHPQRSFEHRAGSDAGALADHDALADRDGRPGGSGRGDLARRQRREQRVERRAQQRPRRRRIPGRGQNGRERAPELGQSKRRVQLFACSSSM